MSIEEAQDYDEYLKRRYSEPNATVFTGYCNETGNDADGIMVISFRKTGDDTGEKLTSGELIIPEGAYYENSTYRRLQTTDIEIAKKTESKLFKPFDNASS